MSVFNSTNHTQDKLSLKAIATLPNQGKMRTVKELCAQTLSCLIKLNALLYFHISSTCVEQKCQKANKMSGQMP